MVQNLRNLRTQYKVNGKSLTRKELAEALQLTERQIQTYESEKIEPDISILMRMADFFGVTVDNLVGHSEMPLNQLDEQIIPPVNLSRFGEKLATLREERGLTRKEVAHLSGMSRAYYALIENGKSIPKLNTALRLINVFGVSSDYVFMDTVYGASAQKSTYLQYRLAGLSPKNKAFVLNLMETIIKDVEKNI